MTQKAMERRQFLSLGLAAGVMAAAVAGALLYTRKNRTRPRPGEQLLPPR